MLSGTNGREAAWRLSEERHGSGGCGIGQREPPN